MRIGMAQMDISWENIEDNKKKVEQFFKKAEENQVDCLVFPEMTLTGFSMNVEETGVILRFGVALRQEKIVLIAPCSSNFL